MSRNVRGFAGKQIPRRRDGEQQGPLSLSPRDSPDPVKDPEESEFRCQGQLLGGSWVVFQVFFWRAHRLARRIRCPFAVILRLWFLLFGLAGMVNSMSFSSVNR